MAGRKITVLPTTSGGTGFVIGDDSLGRGVGQREILRTSPNFDSIVQEVNYLRAPSVVFFARQNEKVVFAVEVAYEFNTPDEQLAFQLNVQSTVPEVGNVEIISGATRVYLKGAKLRPITTVQDYGVLWVARFNIEGGMLLTTQPTV